MFLWPKVSEWQGGRADVEENKPQSNAGTHGRPKATTIKEEFADPRQRPHSSAHLFPESWAKFAEGRN
jgi:hypothetical protein